MAWSAVACWRVVLSWMRYVPSVSWLIAIRDVGVRISVYLRIGGGSHPMVPTKALAGIVWASLVVGHRGR